MSLHRLLARRAYSNNSRPSPHADFYASLLPAMFPVALLGSAIYLSLHLVQSRLAHEKFLDDARDRIQLLEAQVDSLQTQRSSSVQAPSSKKPSWWSYY